MDKRDMVVRAITGYNFSQITSWVNSLDRCGFEGIKAVLAYNVDFATLEELTKRGYTILAFQKDDAKQAVTYPKDRFSIVVERFLHYHLFLHTPANLDSLRYIIAPDVRDVVF